jgi:putative nucleotidyltransferase with HDIG domain
LDETARQLLARIEDDILSNRFILPSLPEVAIRVRELSARDDVDLSQLEIEISRDAAIAARILKVANSSAMQRGNPSNSLKQAIARLGLGLVRSLVTQLAILQTMQGCEDKQRLHDFVDNGLKISALCHSLCQQLPHLDKEQAALAGLLHDIGKLPMRRFLNRYGISEDTEQALQLEQQLHPQVGAIMLRHWQLADELVQVSREHEEMLRDHTGPADYTDLVICANLLHYGTEQGRYAMYAGQDIPAMQRCQLDKAPAQMEKHLERRMEISLTLVGTWNP